MKIAEEILVIIASNRRWNDSYRQVGQVKCGHDQGFLSLGGGGGGGGGGLMTLFLGGEAGMGMADAVATPFGGGRGGGVVTTGFPPGTGGVLITGLVGGTVGAVIRDTALGGGGGGRIAIDGATTVPAGTLPCRTTRRRAPTVRSEPLATTVS